MTHRSLVELVFDQDCPHVSLARDVLRAALVATGRPVRWHEWDRHAASTPVELRNYGSPTILVAGNDVADTDGPAFVDGVDRCRLYEDRGVLVGAPPLDQVIAALARNTDAFHDGDGLDLPA
jgi:hypothetical protein